MILRLAFALLLVAPWTAVGAGDITVLCSQGAAGLLRAVSAPFEQSSDDHLSIQYGPTRLLTERILGGARFDAAILSAASIDQLNAAHLLLAEPQGALGHSALGVAIALGAPKPDLATPETFLAALRAADGIAYSNGPSGRYFVELMQRLGVWDQIKAKTQMADSASAADLVADGQASVAVQQTTELIGVKGTELAGLFPAELQSFTPYVAAIGSQASNPDGARTLIAYLTAPAQAPQRRAAGLEP